MFIAKLVATHATSLGALRASLPATIEALMIREPPIEKLARLATTPSAAAALRYDAYSSGAPAANAHLLDILGLALTLGPSLVDLEGTVLGEECAPADLVYLLGDAVILVDAFSADSDREEKGRNLDRAVRELSVVYPDTIFQWRTARVTTMRVYDQVPASPLTHDRIRDAFSFDYVNALRGKAIDVSRFYAALTPAMPVPTVRPIAPAVRSACRSVMAGDSSPMNLKAVLDEAGVMYPATVKHVRTITALRLPTVRGIAAPSEGSPAIPAAGTSWASLLSAALILEAGEAIGWSVGAIPAACARRTSGLSQVPLDPSVVLTCVRPGVYRASVSSDAPIAIRDLMGRENDRIEREEIEPLSPLAAALRISEIEMAILPLSAPTSVTYPSPFSRAGVIASVAAMPGGPYIEARARALELFAELDATVGSGYLAMARMIGLASRSSCRGSGDDTITVDRFAGGRILIASKHTGVLSKPNATCCIVAVSQPQCDLGSWLASSGGGIGLSKCLFISKSRADWYSAAHSSVFALAAGYDALASHGASDSRAIAPMCLTAVGAGKRAAVALQKERAYVLGATSFVSSMDDTTKKVVLGRPNTELDVALQCRMMTRALAAAVLRDTGTLEDSVTCGAGNRKAPEITPVFASSGHMTPVGLFCSFYDGQLGDPASSSLARDYCGAASSILANHRAYEAEAAGDWKSNAGASRAAIAAWEEGRLPAYVSSPTFEMDEAADMVLKVSRRLTYYSCLAFVVAASADCAYTKTPGAMSDEIAYALSTADISEVMTTKVAMTGPLEDRQTAPSYEVMAAHAMSAIAPGAAALDPTTIASSLTLPAGRRPATVMSVAAIALVAKEAILISPAPKVLSLEALRDLAILRPPDRCVLYVAGVIGRTLNVANPVSALHAPSKLLRVFEDHAEARRPGRVNVDAAYDCKTYGPTKDAAAMLAVGVGAGLSGPILDLFGACLAALPRKRVVAPAIMRRMEPEEIERLTGPVRDDAKALLRAGASGLPVAPGMTQGLAQEPADALSAVRFHAIARIMTDMGYKTVSSSTNDDAKVTTSCAPAEVAAVAMLMSLVAETVGVACGETINKSKLFISTWATELNTQGVVNGSAVMAWVRCLTSLLSTCKRTEYHASAGHAMSSTNASISEGAPLYVQVAATALAFVGHYERINMVGPAMRGEWGPRTCLDFGRPVIAPTLVAACGATATAIALGTMAGGTSRAAEVASACARAFSNALAVSELVKWSSDPGLVRAPPSWTSVMGVTARMSKVVSREARMLTLRDVPTNFFRTNDLESGTGLAAVTIRRIKELLSVGSSGAFEAGSLADSYAGCFISAAKARVVMAKTTYGPTGTRVDRALVTPAAARAAMAQPVPEIDPVFLSLADAGATISAHVRLADEMVEAFSTTGRLVGRYETTDLVKLASKPVPPSRAAVLLAARTISPPALAWALDVMLLRIGVRPKFAIGAPVDCATVEVDSLVRAVRLGMEDLADVPGGYFILPASADTSSLATALVTSAMATVAPGVAFVPDYAPGFVTWLAPTPGAIDAAGSAAVLSVAVDAMRSTAIFGVPLTPRVAARGIADFFRASPGAPKGDAAARSTAFRGAAVPKRFPLTPEMVAAYSKTHERLPMVGFGSGVAVSRVTNLQLVTVAGRPVPYVAACERTMLGGAYIRVIWVVAGGPVAAISTYDGFTCTRNPEADGEWKAYRSKYEDCEIRVIRASGEAYFHVVGCPPVVALSASGAPPIPLYLVDLSGADGLTDTSGYVLPRPAPAALPPMVSSAIARVVAMVLRCGEAVPCIASAAIGSSIPQAVSEVLSAISRLPRAGKDMVIRDLIASCVDCSDDGHWDALVTAASMAVAHAGNTSAVFRYVTQGESDAISPADLADLLAGNAPRRLAGVLPPVPAPVGDPVATALTSWAGDAAAQALLQDDADTAAAAYSATLDAIWAELLSPHYDDDAGMYAVAIAEDVAATPDDSRVLGLDDVTCAVRDTLGLDAAGTGVTVLGRASLTIARDQVVVPPAAFATRKSADRPHTLAAAGAIAQMVVSSAMGLSMHRSTEATALGLDVSGAAITAADYLSLPTAGDVAMAHYASTSTAIHAHFVGVSRHRGLVDTARRFVNVHGAHADVMVPEGFKASVGVTLSEAGRLGRVGTSAAGAIRSAMVRGVLATVGVGPLAYSYNGMDVLATPAAWAGRAPMAATP